ncbi:MAG: exonuclease SbcCD subunit D [Pleurocapsa minor GSE-CHR-MK-17-07R]|jgi:exonuclease SbcD|nr:exonuclease SbcCD subunit D [Pleurocapsa minor GSE-CHR-MK 17-07R]
MTRPPIRVLHFADAHIGIETHGRIDPATGMNTRLLDFLHRLDDIIAFVQEHGVDLIIFAGDAFKTRTPTPTQQREFAFRMRDLSALAPVILLEGNHDLPQQDRKASSVEIYDTLRVPNVMLANTFELHVVETARGPVAVGCAPYPVRQRLMDGAATAGLSIAQIDQMVQHNLGMRLEELAEEADAVGPEVPRLLTGHFTVQGAVTGSERQIMLGRDIEVPLSVLADARWDYVALGHIHKHQNLTHGRPGTPPVVYSGSFERIDFGEEADTKGFCMVELARNATTWAFHQVDARPFVTLNADLRESETPTAEMVDQIERTNVRDAVVRIQVRLTPESAALFDEGSVRDALKRGGAHVIASLKPDIERTQRARLGTSPEQLSDQDLLERHLLAREFDEGTRQALHTLADAIFAARFDQKTGE